LRARVTWNAGFEVADGYLTNWDRKMETGVREVGVAGRQWSWVDD
jgi:hypothetical protein